MYMGALLHCLVVDRGMIAAHDLFFSDNEPKSRSAIRLAMAIFVRSDRKRNDRSAKIDLLGQNNQFLSSVSSYKEGESLLIKVLQENDLNPSHSRCLKVLKILLNTIKKNNLSKITRSDRERRSISSIT
ncbi:hypothetical protein BpHYR1_021155 [Brachionus plicatilis]|uniref:Uncharacterized protein n=1 Tax=Brachionus plicatilis TaxID=10195 RepID=A0A3M7P2E7_BRAPC|nr:hypothetical protein BpHYR1_021155 [Brachionus plicatilis]